MASKQIAVILNLKDAFTSPLKKVAERLNTTEKELKKATNTIRSFQRQATAGFRSAALAVGGFGLAFAGAIGAATKTTLDYAAEVKKFQRLTGESAESASALIAVGKKYGVSADGMAKAMRMLGVKAVNNGKDFAKYGLTVKDAHGQLLPAAKILENVADKYKQLGGGLKGAVFVQKLMGRGSMQLVPLLQEGSAGLKAMEADAAHMGLVLTKDNMTAFSKFTEAQKRFNQAMLGVQITIGSKLLPVLAELATQVNTAITKFDFRRVGIAATQVFKTVGNAIKFLMDNLNWIIPVIAGVIGTIAGFKTVSFVLGLTKEWIALTKALTVTQGIWNALLLANPIGLIAVGIGLLIAAGIALYMNWDKVCAFAKNLWGWLMQNKQAFLVLLGPFGLVIAAGITIYKNWDTICKKAKEMCSWLGKITGFGGKTVDVKINKNEKTSVIPQNNPIKKPPAHATGTSYFAGGATGINEGGRGEIVNLPSGSQIIPHDISKKAVGKSITVNLGGIHIAGNMVGNHEFIDQLGNIFAGKIKVALANI